MKHPVSPSQAEKLRRDFGSFTGAAAALEARLVRQHRLCQEHGFDGSYGEEYRQTQLELDALRCAAQGEQAWRATAADAPSAQRRAA